MMTRITYFAHAFGRTRETSPAVAQAILDLALGDLGRAQQLWAEPNPLEDARIVADAWKLADPNETELHWGQSTLRRS